MTALSRLQRIGPPVAAALATAAILSGALWLQRTRDAWPFTLRAAAPPTAAHATDPAGGDRVPVDAPGVRALDIRLETVASRAVAESVRAVATVALDESRISHVHTRVAGWVEQLDVNTTGEVVQAGQPLARIFSQELLSSQTEYLAARRNTAALGITSAVVTSGRTRLSVLGIAPAEIDAIERTGEPMRLITILAPRSGVVMNRGVTVGTSVDPATTLLTIADLSRVWILAEVPEANIHAVGVGARAELDFPASGRAPFVARVDFVYPVLTERTRTLRVRLSAPNANGALRPGLYGTAIFVWAGRQAITVPRDAVVDTGVRQHVFVAVGDRFEPREVSLGAQLADRIEVREGLRAGEQIVAAGVFLLDSESRLRATGSAGGHTHDTPVSREPAPPAPARDPGAGRAPPPADPHAGHRG